MSNPETTPRVSVIIPARNEAGNIAPVVSEIEAALGPLGPFEIVYVNDGSTDQTETIIKQLPVDIRYFSQENSGPAAARNRGIRDASGEFITFLDVDDLWPENNLHRLVAEMLREPELEVVRGYGQLMEQNVQTKVNH